MLIRSSNPLLTTAAMAQCQRQPNAKANSKDTIEINLDHHFTSRVYTSGSTISGHAVINFQHDTSFDNLDITFTGIAATRLDFVQSYITKAVRPFLKLHMPISDTDIPEPRIFEADRTYSIPFHFVVPYHLPLGSCHHGDRDPAVQDEHLRMPPTLGYWDGDDQAPEVTHIEYAIKAKLTRSRTGNDNGLSMEGKTILKVLPATPEQPPLSITSRDERYCLSITKSLRKSLLGGTYGELVAQSSQPKAVMIQPDGLGAHDSEVKIDLEFTPTADDLAPPKLNSVTGKLISTTFFSNDSIDALLNLGPKTTYADNQVLTSSTTTKLFHTPLDKLSWSEHNLPVASVNSRSSDESCKDQNKGPSRSSIRHHATFSLPIKLPISNKRMFVPTFDSCLISRIYILQLALCVGPTSLAMTLEVPLQLGVEHLDHKGNERLPSFESFTAQSDETEAGRLPPRVFG